MNGKKGNSTHKIVYELVSSPKKRMGLFKKIPVNNQGFILLGLSRKLQQEILDCLMHKEILQLLHYLDPDEVTDLLHQVDEGRKKKLLSALSNDVKEKVEFLLRFNPRTAAGMMSLDYIAVQKNETFDEVAKTIQKHERKTGKFPTILVVKNGYLEGELPGHIFTSHKPTQKVGQYIRDIPIIKYDRDQHAIINVFKRNPHNKIAVLDEDKSIIGIIFSDDVLRVIQGDAEHDLYDFAGVSEEEDILDGAFTKVKHRYKWLILNLATAFLAASVIGFYQDTISALVLLAVYMPIIAGMGGNAATQTLAVVVRGLVMREIDYKKAKRVIRNEMLAGGVNGVVNGTLVAGVAFFWNQNPVLGVTVGIAMVVNLIVAGFFGTAIPLLMKHLGKDPATSATVFITTATDICGFFVFLGLATALL
jgi:magnesium transporter